MNLKRNIQWIVLTGVILFVVGGLVWLTSHKISSAAETAEKNPHSENEQHDGKIPVQVVRGKKGELQRLSTQPGSLQAFESVRLFAKVPGFLKKQTVDIGDTVKSGQVLAIVDIPELQAQLKRNRAGVKQARAQVNQMKARVDSARAELVAAKATLTRSIASEKSAAAWVRYRLLQLRRMEALVKSVAVEQKLEDEAKASYEASVETELAAQEAITANKAKIVADQAKIEQALADVEAAEAQVEVTQGDLEKVQAQVAFATITAPFDGVITTRSMYENDFVRAANEGSNSEPLLTVNRTDKFRVVVLIPDRDVPFTDVGDLAEVEIDSLPGKKFPGKVSRFAKSLDPQTRLMRVEIDVPNPTGQLCQGMYGHVSIVLDRERDLFSIPTSCLLAQDSDGKAAAGMGNLRWDIPTKQPAAKAGDAAAVFVVRDGRVQRVSIRLGTNTGLRAAVLSGLNANDQVVFNPQQSLVDGARVTPLLRDE